MKTRLTRLFALLLIGATIAGCSGVSELVGKPKNVPPELRQKVGLYVHDKPERFFYPGTATLDVSDLMSFHLQQTLPFTSQTALQEIFSDVVISDTEGPKIRFKADDLAGFFEITISSIRYDFPDARATRFEADCQLLVEFKTFKDEVIWQQVFQGQGVGYSDPNIRLTKFGRDASSALEDAFQSAVYEMQDAILHSPTLLEYFRWYNAKNNPGSPPAPAPPAAAAPSQPTPQAQP